MLQVPDQAGLERAGSAVTATPAHAVGDPAAIAVPSHPLGRRIRGWLAWAAIFALLAWAWAPAEMYRVVALFTDWRNMAQFGAAFLKPNFHDWDQYLADMVVTVQIAIWGTALAVVFGIPFSILSAANVCPQCIVQPVRRLMDACRAINEIVFALMFVVAVGLGPFARHRRRRRDRSDALRKHPQLPVRRDRGSNHHRGRSGGRDRSSQRSHPQNPGLTSAVEDNVLGAFAGQSSGGIALEKTPSPRSP